MYGLAVMLAIAAGAPAGDVSASSPVVTVFAESCARIAGDRDALRRIAEARNWPQASVADGQVSDKVVWVDAYAVGSSTIYLFSYSAGSASSSGAGNVVSVRYPGAVVCRVSGVLQDGWREPLREVAEDRLGMTLNRPIVHRDSNADFQTAWWSRDDDQVEGQYRRPQNTMDVTWTRTLAPAQTR
jgi:hypothetical protein